MADLSELIKTLENAERGSEDLDRAIAGVADPAGAGGPELAYSTSLDAALTLLPAVGYWELMCITNDGFTQYACEIHPGKGHEPVIGTGRAAALAVGAAALKAREEAAG